MWVDEYGTDVGVPEQSGERTDVSATDNTLREIQALIVSGVPEPDLWANPELFPALVKYHRGIREFYSLRCATGKGRLRHD